LRRGYMKNAFEGFDFGAGHAPVGFGHFCAENHDAHRKGCLFNIGGEIAIAAPQARPGGHSIIRWACVMDMADDEACRSTPGPAQAHTQHAADDFAPGSFGWNAAHLPAAFFCCIIFR